MSCFYGSLHSHIHKYIHRHPGRVLVALDIITKPPVCKHRCYSCAAAASAAAFLSVAANSAAATSAAFCVSSGLSMLHMSTTAVGSS
jgi:hypothetical protein